MAFEVQGADDKSLRLSFNDRIESARRELLLAEDAVLRIDAFGESMQAKGLFSSAFTARIKTENGELDGTPVVEPAVIDIIDGDENYIMQASFFTDGQIVLSPGVQPVDAFKDGRLVGTVKDLMLEIEDVASAMTSDTEIGKAVAMVRGGKLEFKPMP